MLGSKGFENDPCTKFYGLDEKIENGIINGGEWKHTNSTMQDYSYMFPSILDIDFFISCVKKPDPIKIIDFWLENKNSLINFINQTHQGIKGLLIDDEKNKTISGIDIVLKIDRIDDEKKMEKLIVFNSRGDYFRILLPGIYNVSIGSAYW